MAVVDDTSLAPYPQEVSTDEVNSTNLVLSEDAVNNTNLVSESAWVANPALVADTFVSTGDEVHAAEARTDETRSGWESALISNPD